MTYNVRIFGYKGIVQVQQRLVKQFNADSVFLLDDPYEWSQIINVAEGTGAAGPSVAQPPPDNARLVYVEIPDGKQVRYEVNPSGPGAANARVAGNLSPRISGFHQLPYNPGCTYSFVDAAFFQ